jgi:hypothetical protein
VKKVIEVAIGEICLLIDEDKLIIIPKSSLKISIQSLTTNHRVRNFMTRTGRKEE